MLSIIQEAYLKYNVIVKFKKNIKKFITEETDHHYHR